jgi:hypothetical protein
MSACRSCGAEVTWTVTTTGARMPVDTAPVDGGNVLLSPPPIRGGAPVATVVGKRVQPSIFGDDGPRYVSHFMTCPHADAHRRSH